MGRDHDPGGASQEPGNRSKGAPHGAPFPLGEHLPLPMPTSDPHNQQEGTASPKSAPPEKPLGILDAMRLQLEQHSALEDLGPLFGPQAQGEGPGRDGPARDPR